MENEGRIVRIKGHSVNVHLRGADGELVAGPDGAPLEMSEAEARHRCFTGYYGPDSPPGFDANPQKPGVQKPRRNKHRHEEPQAAAPAPPAESPEGEE